MSHRLITLITAAMLLAPLSAAHAILLASNPITHGSGFSTVACTLVNAGDKPLVVETFFIEPIVTTVSHANEYTGCLGAPPYTIQPGQGCTRRMTSPSVCNPGDACYCYAKVKGSSKVVRGLLVGTVSGSTATVTSELRVK